MLVFLVFFVKIGVFNTLFGILLGKEHAVLLLCKMLFDFNLPQYFGNTATYAN